VLSDSIMETARRVALAANFGDIFGPVPPIGEPVRGDTVVRMPVPAPAPIRP
jgi:hypothetical protein